VTKETELLEEQLRHAWRFRARAVPISLAPQFTPEGLVLGAGTILLPTEGARRLKKLDDEKERVLALLSAAYGESVAFAVLGHVERAAKAWSEGDDCLAYIHLAHARLPEPDDATEAARRLFIVDAFMKAGASPRTVLHALAPALIENIEKLYNEAEPRVPPGSGRASGEWARGGSFLGQLAPEAVKALGRFALGLLARRAGAAVAVFGVLFIPSPNRIRIEGDVQDLPGLHYAWNRDETQIHFTYDSGDGQPRTFAANLEDDVFRDERGRVVGRVLPDGIIAIDTAAVSPDLIDEDEPRLCPAPGKDRGGSERGRDYEDYVKRFVNPGNPTPRGMGYQLLKPDSDDLVYYDDCQHSTGMMVDAKGEYAGIRSFEQGKGSIGEKWLQQSASQIAAANGRRIRWYFAEAETAAYAKELFRTKDQGRENIEIAFLPWPGSRTRNPAKSSRIEDHLSFVWGEHNQQISLSEPPLLFKTPA
jgi:hypothetical protein